MTNLEKERALLAAHVLRGLRANKEMRALLNRLADVIVTITIKNSDVVLAKIRRLLRNIQEKLKDIGTLDDVILVNALGGVVGLLMPV